MITKELPQFKKHCKVSVLASLDEGKSWKSIHQGVVVGQTTLFLQVFNHKEGNGDTVPECAQWYPIDAKLMKVVKV